MSPWSAARKLQSLSTRFMFVLHLLSPENIFASDSWRARGSRGPWELCYMECASCVAHCRWISHPACHLSKLSDHVHFPAYDAYAVFGHILRAVHRSGTLLCTVDFVYELVDNKVGNVGTVVSTGNVVWLDCPIRRLSQGLCHVGA